MQHVQTSYTYRDLVERLFNLEVLAVPPVAGERSGSFSSFDRSSVYNEATSRYENWGANDDGGGYIREEDSGIVACELDGPGVIWRVWSALPGEGHIRIYLDNSMEPVIDKPFRDYFEKFSDEGCPANFPNIAPTLSRGRNSYIPIPFQKHCKVVLDKDWGSYYHFTYTQFPNEVQLPDFTGKFDKDSSIALAEADRLLQNRGRHRPHQHQPHNDRTVSLSIPAGGKSVALDHAGAGAISMIRIRTELAHQTEDQQRIALRQLVISMKWDHEDKPSVWAPLGDFFGSAPGIKPYRALPLGMDGNEFYCNWYMPFSEGAIIEIANDGPELQTLVIDIRTVSMMKEQADKLLRFHAKWHRDAFLDLEKERYVEGGDRWPDWPLLLAEGPGRFCGVHLHVYNAWKKPDQDADTWWYGREDRKTIDWWWGEGDEKFFIDGETFPSTFGTGSEDYIGYAWAAEPPFPIFDSAFACQPYVEIDGNGHTSVNRFHICDNIPFIQSFEGFIEKYKANDWEDGNRCLYASTVYWYQARGTIDRYVPIELQKRIGYDTLNDEEPTYKNAKLEDSL
ncbi:glycoside hydrolase family 172 protein [Paenibacillus sp. 2TAB23]|uniref:glycoside hydrolase family 172 protein n=1 Tax=Paenibacillus sp. 2TAB23 TaxID=3233004 RepID=UPI003F9E9855